MDRVDCACISFYKHQFSGSYHDYVFMPLGQYEHDIHFCKCILYLQPISRESPDSVACPLRLVPTIQGVSKKKFTVGKGMPLQKEFNAFNKIL